MAQPIDHGVLTRVSACPVSACPAAGPAPAIRVVWPDREHAVIGVTGGATGRHWLEELRERVQALLTGGVRFLLVDLSDAACRDEDVVGILADAAAGMRRRNGWLRVHRSCTAESPPCPPVAEVTVAEVTLPDLFAIYRALGHRGEP